MEDSKLIGKKFILGLCACGCGLSIKLRSQNRGELRRYERGHNSRGAAHPNWHGGKGIHAGYEMIRIDTHKYKRAHRIIMEMYLGRQLESFEVIHHINGNKKDNRIESHYIQGQKHIHCVCIEQ